LKPKPRSFLRRVLRWLIALLLLPFVVAAGLALFKTAGLLQRDPAAWVGAVCGAISWLFCFWRLPKPMWVYVAGHELTHALAGILCRSMPRSIKISSTGGKVVLPRTNFFITLAPYFIPLYTLLWCFGVWLLEGPMGLPLPSFWVAFGFGLTYMFHVTLTLYILRIQQPDFVAEGHFFSITLTVLANLVFLLLALGCLTHHSSVAVELTAWGVEVMNVFRWLLRLAT